jgi:hypothetical protein
MIRLSKYAVVLFVAFSLASSLEEDTPKENKRTARRALPSVGPDHYSEVLADGTYKYAYTGEHRYVAERKLPDGTIEGESLYVRPDGYPVKVHYFADREGYRPKTEVLYNERIVATRRRFQPQVVREVVPPPAREIVRVAPPAREVIVPAPAPPVIVGPPSGANSVNVNVGGGVAAFRTAGGNGGDINVNTNGGDVAAAAPSVTAIVGPGGQAVVRPEAVARTSGASRYFRSGGGNGDVAIANPHTTAIVGAGGSVVVEPKASAVVGGGGPPEVVREVHHHTQSVVRAAPERIIEKVHVPVPVPVKTVSSPGYVYEAPRPATVVAHAPVPVQPVVVAHQPQPAVAVRSSGVVLVPPSSKYSYSYGYSAPDPKHPHAPNSAYVNVNVNH